MAAQLASQTDTHPPIDAARWIRPKQWVRIVNMSRSATYEALWSGQLRAVRIGSSWYIDASEIEAFFARNAESVA